MSVKAHITLNSQLLSSGRIRRGSLDELRALVAVGHERSFTRTAAKLGVSQSALSQTIRQLEERIGIRLLTRMMRGVSLTEACERLVRTVAAKLVRKGWRSRTSPAVVSNACSRIGAFLIQATIFGTRAGGNLGPPSFWLTRCATGADRHNGKRRVGRAHR
jgi:hypothetical protein